MSLELPIACTLTPGDLQDRLGEMAALGRAALLAAEVGGADATLRFRRAPDVGERVDRLVAAEADCCRFLTFRVAHENDSIVVRVVAPPDAAPALAEWVGAFRTA